MSDGGHTPLENDTIERDQDLWFDDGNVVFIAQSVAFRVHKSVMSRHSDVFTGLFAIPQPSDSEDTHSFDGVPSVHVSDTSYDFQQFTYALYGQIGYFIIMTAFYAHYITDVTCRSCIDPLIDFGFPALAAVARMSHKYQIPSLLAKAIQKMNRTFPEKINLTTLRDPDIRTHAIEAVNLFHTLELSNMLVTALYACCQLPESFIAKGAPRADGTVENLAPDDLEICWKLNKRLASHNAHVWYTIVAPFRAGEGSRCPDKDECAAKMKAYAHVNTTLADDSLPDPYFTNSFTDLHEKLRICPVCSMEVFRKVQSSGQKLWKELPSLMGITVKTDEAQLML